MDLLGRYLHAVRFWLPARQQEDILAELSEDLHSQIEERESELGRKLEESEIAAILQKRGHPTLVATQFLPRQHLIGPVFFATYRFVLKMVTLWILPPLFALIVGPVMVLTAAHPGSAAGRAITAFLQAELMSFAMITLTFAALERFQGAYGKTGEWDPRTLPRVPAETTAASRCGAIGELIMGLVWGAGWTYMAWIHSTFDFHGVLVRPATIWRDLFWPILLVVSSGVPLGLISLMRPARTRLRSAIRLAIDVSGLVLAAILLTAGTWLELPGPDVSPGGLADAARWTNLSVGITLGVAVLATLADALREIRRLMRKGPVARTALNGLA